MDKKQISEILNIQENNDIVLHEPANTPENVEEDFDFSRENLIDLINTGKVAFDDLIGIAQASQHPRAFEVVSTLMKTLLDANKDLIELHKKRKDLIKETPETKTINNNLIVSTAQLQRMLKDQSTDDE